MDTTISSIAPRNVSDPSGLSRILVALGDPVRQQMLLLLSRQELNVSELTERSHLSRPAVSHQIKILADAGLLLQQRRGRERVYRVDAKRFRRFADELKSFVTACCAGPQCC
jgi:DNA-binding transcriptional ArsR family regulator